MIYVITFLLSVIFISIGEKRKNGLLKILFYAIGLIIPSVIAGCRDYTIGTDVLVYGNTWFQYSIEYDGFINYIKYANSCDIGTLYATLNYIVSRFTENVNWFYFVLSFFTTLFAFLGIRQYKNKISISFGIFLYYCIFFNLTLNALRQSIAMTFIFWGVGFIKNKRNICFFLVLILATLFHSTAIICILFMIIYKLNTNKIRNIFKYIIIIFATISTIFFTQLVNFFINVGILSDRFDFYISNVQRGGGYVRLFLLCLPVWILFLIYKKNNRGYDIDVQYCFFMLFLSTIISGLAFKMTYIVRIAYYFDIFLIVFIPMLVNKIKIGTRNFISRNKYINYTYLFVGLYYFIYWIIVYCVMGSGQTYPYISNILKF